MVRGGGGTFAELRVEGGVPGARGTTAGPFAVEGPVLVPLALLGAPPCAAIPAFIDAAFLSERISALA